MRSYGRSKLRRHLTRFTVATGIFAVVATTGAVTGVQSASAATIGPVASATVPVDMVGGAYTVTVNRDISDPVTLASGSIPSPVLTVPLNAVSLPPGNYIVNFVATHLIDSSHTRIVVGSEGVDASTLAAAGAIAFTPGVEHTATAYPNLQTLLEANLVGQHAPSCSVCTRQVVTTALPATAMLTGPSESVGDQCGSSSAVASPVALTCAEQLLAAAAVTIKTAEQSDAGVSLPVPGPIVVQTSIFDAVNQALDQAGACVAQTDPTCAAIVKDLEIRDQNNIIDFVNQIAAQAVQEAENCGTQTDPTCATVVQIAEQEEQAVEATATSCLDTDGACGQLVELVSGEIDALTGQCASEDPLCVVLLGTASGLTSEAVTCLTGPVSSSAPAPDVSSCQDLESAALNALNGLPNASFCSHQPADGGTGTYCSDPCPNAIETANSQTPFDCTSQTIEQDGIPALRGMADRVAGETTTFSFDKSEQSQWDIEYRAGVGPFSVDGHKTSTDTYDEGEAWPVMGDCWTGKPPQGQHTPAPTGDYCSLDGATEMMGQDAWQWEKHYTCQNEGLVGPYYCTDYETDHQIAFDGGTAYRNQGILSGYYADPLQVQANNDGQWSSVLPGSLVDVRLSKQHYYSQAVHFDFNPGSNYGGADFTAGMSQLKNTTVTNHMAFRNTAQVPWNHMFYRYDIHDSPFGSSRWTSEMAPGYIRPSGTTSNYPWPYGT